MHFGQLVSSPFVLADLAGASPFGMVWGGACGRPETHFSSQLVLFEGILFAYRGRRPTSVVVSASSSDASA